MSTKPPYLIQPTVIKKILDKIRDAKTPDRFTIDFLEGTLGCKGGNYRAFISLAKKLGLLNTDGSPTELYRGFRNPSTSKAAMAEAIRKAYGQIFERNENAGKVPREELKGLIVHVTGLSAKDAVVGLTCRTFDALKAFADFDRSLADTDVVEVSAEPASERTNAQPAIHEPELRLSYVINLVLPKSDDPAIFNAIFKALRENLLRK